MFVVHETLLNKRIFLKIMYCPSIKSPPLSYGNGFFLKQKYYDAFIA
jgi:hypothetical protein